MISVVLILPAHLRDDGNRLACALGHDTLPGTTYGTPLSPTGSEPPTHYGARTWAEQSFVDTLNAAAEGSVPTIQWATFGLTEEAVSRVVRGLVYSVVEDASVLPHEQFGAMLENLGLTPVQTAFAD